jgi:hypothetical protein
MAARIVPATCAYQHSMTGTGLHRAATEMSPHDVLNALRGGISTAARVLRTNLICRCPTGKTKSTCGASCGGELAGHAEVA